MATADNKEQFERRWNSHISELSKLGMSLPADRVSEIIEIREELEELVEVAAENMEE